MDYLSSGGLFNPELANHEAVRDLLIECSNEIARLREVEGAYGRYHREVIEKLASYRDARIDERKTCAEIAGQFGGKCIDRRGYDANVSDIRRLILERSP